MGKAFQLQLRFKSSTLIHILKVTKVFLSTFLAVQLTKNYLISAFLMKLRRKRFTQNKLLWLKRKRNQTARIVPLVMVPTRVKFGVLVKWTPTMYLLGARVVKATLRIAKCCVKLIIEQKVIGKQDNRIKSGI